MLPEGVYTPQEFFPAMYRHQLGGIHTPSIASVGVMSRRSALESVGRVLRRHYTSSTGTSSSTCAWRCASRPGSWPSGTSLQRLHHPSITSEMPLRRRALDPLPRLSRRMVPAGAAGVRAAAAVRPAALRGLHHRRARRARAGRPPSRPQPSRQRGARVPAIAAQPARRGRRRSRCSSAGAGPTRSPSGASARREQSETLVYEPAGTGSV